MSEKITAAMTKKRERTQNWVPEEKSALLALITSHIYTIENKKVDAAASAMKTLAWQQIHHAFRSKFSTKRDVTRMREQWRRMKAQARIEMYTFIEKIKSAGLKEATKCRPSNLSIEIWRLMENIQKPEYDTECSDEHPMDLREIVDKFVLSTTEVSDPEIKVEANNQLSDVEEDDSFVEMSQLSQQKKLRLTYNEGNNQQQPKNNNSYLKSDVNSNNDEDVSIQKTNWVFKAAQEEYSLKLKVLKIDLDRAELQKQIAMHELKTTEVKRLLTESQVGECRIRMAGEPGSGAGKGGGGGGSIREAGGSFGRMEAAHEDQYFYNQQKEQLQKMREGLHDEISFHEEQIKRHQEAINRHKKRISDMEKQ